MAFSTSNQKDPRTVLYGVALPMEILLSFSHCGSSYVFGKNMRFGGLFCCKNGGVFEIAWNMSKDLLFSTTRFCNGAIHINILDS